MEKNKKQLVRYTPCKRGRKWVTKVTGGNGGLHRQEEFKKGVRMLEHCAHHFRNPRLFHICFTGADVPVYQLVMRRFCRALTGAEVEYRYKAAVEEDSEKGLHCHVMIVLEGGNHYTMDRFLKKDESGEVESESSLRKAWRHTLGDCNLLDYRVCRPLSRRGLAFIQFNQSNKELLNEAVEWLSYIYKARSKPESGTVYFSDRQGA